MNNTDFKKTLFDVNFISTIILTVIGAIGNLLVIFVFTRPQFLKVSMFRYLIVATISNTINLLANWPSVYPDFFYVNKLSISCKIFYYFFYVPYQVSPWILSLTSIDRYLKVKYPTTLQFRNNFKYQLMAIIGIIVLISLINIPIYIYHDVEANNGCLTTDNTVQVYLDILNALLGVIIPFVIMAVTTFLIGHELIKKKKNLKQENKKRFERDLNLIKTLLIMDSYFLLLNLPYCIYMIACDLLNINAFDTLTLYIVCILTYIFSSCDFFIFIIFNKLFRNYFISIIKGCQMKQHVESKPDNFTDL